MKVLHYTVYDKMAEKYNNDSKYKELLNNITFYLHRRSCYIDQLHKLCSESHHSSKLENTQNQILMPLFDCLIVVGLKNSDTNEFYKPFIKTKYPKSVGLKSSERGTQN